MKRWRGRHALLHSSSYDPVSLQKVYSLSHTHRRTETHTHTHRERKTDETMIIKRSWVLCTDRGERREGKGERKTSEESQVLFHMKVCRIKGGWGHRTALLFLRGQTLRSATRPTCHSY